MSDLHADSRSKPSNAPGQRIAALCALLVSALLIAMPLSASAQQPAHPEAKKAEHKKQSTHRHHAKKPALERKLSAISAPPAPPVPPTPRWPVNEPPAPPTITWDSNGLEIKAANSSLRQILDEVGADTGAKIEGMGADQRVFGTYGPGPAHDVLSQLLHGTPYNVLILGDQGSGTPREVILSERSTGPASNPVQSQPEPQPDNEDQENPPEENPPPVIINRPPLSMPPQGPPVTPQQRLQQMQEMERERQRQLQQQPPQ